jgi:flagellar biosynthesis/type III secretory pathway chaperone
MEKGGEFSNLSPILKDLTQLRVQVWDVFSRTSLWLQSSPLDWRDILQQRVEHIQSTLELLRSHAHELDGS